MNTYAEINKTNNKPKAANKFFGNNSFIQPKLTINNPNDAYEQEADAVADKVMRMENPSIQTKPMAISSLQRKCAHCEEEEKKMQRKETNMQETTADSSLENYVGNLSSSGQQLPNEVRSFYEPRFGYDFSNVKVHTNTVAAKSAQSINALAYTSGNNIVFNNGQYAPQTDSGKRLLGHELTHVVQQGNKIQAKAIQRTLGDGHDLLATRFQGRLQLEAAFDNERLIKNGDHGPDVVILQLALIDAGHALPNFGADGRFGPETETAVRDFQLANGLVVDGLVGPRTMEMLDGLFTIGPVIVPVCNDPGVARTVNLQPVFIRCGAADPDPTGGSYFDLLTKANEIWSKLGVTFTTSSPVIIDDCVSKTSGTTNAEQSALGVLHTGPGVEVVFVDNDIANAGGASTLSAGNGSNVVLSDFGTSPTLLAHELGHVLGLNHPPANADAGTIMEPSGSHSVANPERNTLANAGFITFPVGTDPICMRPDP
ncbi:MAG: DUF4157 domain-containing protein [Panacibacter sp.]